MDDPGGDNLDPGLHGDQLRFLGLLVEPQVGARDLAGAAQLPRGRLRPREGLRVVVWIGLDVYALVGGALHVGLHGVHWLWPPMARHQGNHNPSLYPGMSLSVSLSLNKEDKRGKKLIWVIETVLRLREFRRIN